MLFDYIKGHCYALGQNCMFHVCTLYLLVVSWAGHNCVPAALAIASHSEGMLCGLWPPFLCSIVSSVAVHNECTN